LSFLDFFRKKDPKPVTGELVKGEVLFEGNDSYPYYGWMERNKIDIQLDGKKYSEGILTLRAKLRKNRRTYLFFDQDPISESKQISFGETAQGMKTRTRLMGVIMIILDLLVMYFLYLVASSGFIIQYNPQAMSVFILLIGFIVIAFAVLLIYLWYASKVTVPSVRIRIMDEGPISAALEIQKKGIPAWLTYSTKESVQAYFTRITNMNVSGTLDKISDVLKKIDAQELRMSAEEIAEATDRNDDLATMLGIKHTRAEDDKIAYGERFFTSRSWLPVAISIVIVAAGFIILYLTYG
jgi:hypothetical protein